MPNTNPFVSVETLSTRLGDLFLRSIEAVQKVFVSGDDNVKIVVAKLLLAVGNGVVEGIIPLEFKKSDEGKLTGGFKFEISHEVEYDEDDDLGGIYVATFSLDKKDK